MRGISHSSAGALSTFILLPFLGKISLIYIAAATLGGLIPDLDASESTIKHLKIRFGKRSYIKPFFIPALIVSRFCKHRGGVHSLLGLVCFSVLVQGIVFVSGSVFPPFTTLAFALGYFSHLLLDSWTISGVPLLYPYSKKNYHLFPKKWLVRTGGLADSFFDILFLVIFLLLLIQVMMEGRIE